jgi:WD40 repeat protein
MNNTEIKSGTNMLSFDSSSTLLATRTEALPTTLWIWDIRTKLLRTTLILHAPIAKLTWHPSINEVLMIRCEESRGIVQLWDSSWEKPEVINFAEQMPGGKVIGKTIARWLNVDSPNPAMLFSDSQDCLLATISNDTEEVPWHDAETRRVDIYGQREESPLDFLTTGEKRKGKVTIDALIEEDSFSRMDSGTDEMDDTFQFRKFV